MSQEAVVTNVVDKTDIDLMPVVIVCVLLMSGAYFVKQNEERWVDLAKLVDLSLFLGFQLGFQALIWISMGITKNKHFEHYNILSLIAFLILLKKIFIISLRKIYETIEPKYHLFMGPLVNLVILGIYVFNQSSSKLQSMDLIGDIFRHIYIPNEDPVSMMIFVSLAAEFIWSVVNAASLYVNLTNTQYIQSKCNTSVFTTACSSALQDDSMMYSTFIYFLLLNTYSVWYFKTSSDK